MRNVHINFVFKLSSSCNHTSSKSLSPLFNIVARRKIRSEHSDIIFIKNDLHLEKL